MYEDTCTQGGYHGVRQSIRGQKHRKGPDSWRGKCVPAETADERKETYEEAGRDKENIEIAADGETKKVYLDDIPDRAVTIGAHLSPEEEKELVQFLNKNKDVFAWSAK
jgi:hypothetical protein